MENKMILLVEDNSDDAYLILRALQKSNLPSRVWLVHDGAEALDFLFCRNAYSDRDLHDLPQLILLDLKLPKIDGLEVLEHIRREQTTCNLPVVMFSSSSEPEDIIKAYTRGTNSYVRKPIDSAQFAETVRQIGRYWLMVNEAVPNYAPVIL